MTLLLFNIISQLDYWICLIFGFNLNLFLIWLILFKTPKEIYYFLIIECFGQELYIFNENGTIYYIIPTGDLTIGLIRYTLMLIIALFIALFYAIFILFISPYNDFNIVNNQQYLNNTNLILFQIIDISNLNNSSIIKLFILIFPTIFTLIPFIIIIIIANKMVKYINNNTFPNSKLKNYIKQLTKNLIILAIVPFIYFISTIIPIIFSKFVSNKSTEIYPNTFYLQYICFIFLHLIPIFNPIICILTNKPYRKFIN
ncbi:hypothetical protein Mgra_00004723 [Meloidogyne graminicola]|uniref:Uncharacterized protein n=1 Tax=Meloidogyne graminicola TaxID=189291 RepID=A0A8S9ZQV9_9BILA|nr:hypothetical protein Mgra_00004723 [Meloidogyne graminicola]